MTDEHAYGLSWGIVRGNPIHVRCASKETFNLTWGAFCKPDSARGEICCNCGGPVDEPPRPGFKPIFPDFA